METGSYIVDDQKVKIEPQVKFFDFSSHIGSSDLYSFLQNLEKSNQNMNLFCVHGEETSVDYLAKKANKELDYDSVAPSNGETYQI